jgi:hypothetical protein
VAQPPTWMNRPGDISRLIDAERAGSPFLLLRDGDDLQRILPLGDDGRVVIGRRDTCGVVIDWDERVSRTHAELVAAGGDWTVADDGLSRNGTFVNGERISGRRRLTDRDVIRVGNTSLVFRVPAGEEGLLTLAVDEQAFPAGITEAQRRVLVALCRPCLDPGGFATPATNEAIANELSLSVEAVKGHLRHLFRKFAIGGLPQNQKRMRLAQLAVESGLVGRADLPR